MVRPARPQRMKQVISPMMALDNLTCLTLEVFSGTTRKVTFLFGKVLTPTYSVKEALNSGS